MHTFSPYLLLTSHLWKADPPPFRLLLWAFLLAFNSREINPYTKFLFVINVLSLYTFNNKGLHNDLYTSCQLNRLPLG